MSVEDNFDTSTPMGRFAMHMLLALGELELGRIRDNWATAQEHAVSRGVHIASRSPPGTGAARTGGWSRSSATRTLSRDLRMRGAGARGATARLLEKRRVKTPYGNTSWTTSATSKVMRKRVYLGEATSGRHVNKDAHPAIVTLAEWQAAQGARGVSVPRASGTASCSPGSCVVRGAGT